MALPGDPKYIVVEDIMGNEVIAVFEPFLLHKDLAQNQKVLGAGFVSLSTMTCYGASVSLGVKSRPEADTKLLLKQIFQTEVK